MSVLFFVVPPTHVKEISVIEVRVVEITSRLVGGTCVRIYFDRCIQLRGERHVPESDMLAALAM